MIYERGLQLQRGVIDLSTGKFPVTLFTNGNASDGHIIDIRGLIVNQDPDRTPMFFNHDADPTRRAGGLTNPKKVGKSTRLGGASLKMVGILDVDSDTQMGDIRRDVAQGISVGDITAMSGRWDPVGDPTPRAALPKSHYAYSDVAGFNTPLFFGASKGREGSIVGVGADAAALIGRAQDMSRPQHVRDFYEELTALPPDPEMLTLWARLEELEAALQERIDQTAEIEEEQEELAGVQAVDVTTPEEAEPVRSEPELPELSDGLRPEFVERMRRYIDESPKRVARRASQIAYEKMGFIDE
jgi:hypothetical protein